MNISGLKEHVNTSNASSATSSTRTTPRTLISIDSDIERVVLEADDRHPGMGTIDEPGQAVFGESAKPTRVCVCGTGHAAHVMSTLFPSRGIETNVYTRSSGKADTWSTALHNLGEMELQIQGEDGAARVVRASPSIVTADAGRAVPGCDLIFISLPANAHRAYLEAIAAHVSEGATIVAMPSYPGFAWELRDVFQERFDKVRIVAFENCPWACRFSREFTKSSILATKHEILAFSADQTGIAKVQACLGEKPFLKQASSILAIDLNSGNPRIHLPVMYGKWHCWDGQPCHEEPLFYHGSDEFTVEILMKLSDELMATKQALLRLNPNIDLRGVRATSETFHDYYAKICDDPSSMLGILRTNRGYAGLKHPMVETEDGMFMPNFQTRYMTEDVPMGLVPMRGIAELVGVETPTIDAVLEWAQEACGKEYLKDGTLSGRDIGDSRAPANFGITSVQQLLQLTA